MKMVKKPAFLSTTVESPTQDEGLDPHLYGNAVARCINYYTS